jgi:hypothetical protein
MNVELVHALFSMRANIFCAYHAALWTLTT